MTAVAEREMTTSELAEADARLAWNQMSEPGDTRVGALIRVFGAQAALAHVIHDPNAELVGYALALPSSQVQEAMRQWQSRYDQDEIAKRSVLATEHGSSPLFPSDPAWPGMLNHLQDEAPVMLWIKGNSALLTQSRILSVSGARAATGYGSHITAEIVEHVVSNEITIAAGTAYGIDAIAHRSALASNSPTIAVLAGGIERPYPLAHATLIEKIADEGCVISEAAPGSAPTRWRFLQRNRLIAALSHATLITEAGRNSGSLNLAGHAERFGKPVGAVPGPITSATSAGCHRLIKDHGATLITSGTDTLTLIDAAR